MAEYIEREALMKFPIRRDHYDRKNGNEHFINGIESVLEYAENLPAADVAQVVHGRWEKWNGDDRHHCTVCECYANAERDSYGYIAYEFLDNYCPNCGARMKDA